MFTGKSLFITFVVSLVVGITGGLYAGSLFPSAQLGSGLSKEQVDKLKKLFPPIPEMRSVSGTVKKIDGKTITLEIAESPNPFDEWPTSRKVIVSDSTKIVKVTQKDPKEFQKEMEAYSSGTIANPTNPASLRNPPSFTKEEVIKLTDIKVGDVITVEADHNIKSETQFTAIKISVGMGGSGPAGLIPPPLPPGVPAGNLVPPLPPSGGNLPTPPPVR